MRRYHYYPGCTLKTKTTNLDLSTREALKLLDVELVEPDGWTCCGAEYPLTEEKIVGLAAPVLAPIMLGESETYDDFLWPPKHDRFGYYDGLIDEVRLWWGARGDAEVYASHATPPEASEFISTLKDAEFLGPVGCPDCAGTGYRGRTATHEILVMDDQIRQLVTETLDMKALREAACRGGMKTQMQNGLEKAARGITSIEEVLRVVPTETSL